MSRNPVTMATKIMASLSSAFRLRALLAFCCSCCLEAAAAAVAVAVADEAAEEELARLDAPAAAAVDRSRQLLPAPLLFWVEHELSYQLSLKHLYVLSWLRCEWPGGRRRITLHCT